MNNTVIQYFYTLPNDHHIKPSYHLSPYRDIIILFTVFPMTLKASLEYVKHEVSFRNPSGDVAWQVRYMSLVFRREARAKDINLGFISEQMLFKNREVDEIIMSQSVKERRDEKNWGKRKLTRLWSPESHVKDLYEEERQEEFCQMLMIRQIKWGQRCI